MKLRNITYRSFRVGIDKMVFSSIHREIWQVVVWMRLVRPKMKRLLVKPLEHEFDLVQTCHEHVQTCSEVKKNQDDTVVLLLMLDYLWHLVNEVRVRVPMKAEFRMTGLLDRN